MKFVLLLLLTVIVSTIATSFFLKTTQHVESNQGVSREFTCGPTSLWVAFQRLGVPTGIDKTRRMFKDGTNGGTSLVDLQAVADQLGVVSSVKKIGWQELLKHKGTAILFVQNNHFIAVDPWSRTKEPECVKVFDPDRLFAITMSEHELLEIWDGDCLLLSKRGLTDKTTATIECNYLLEDAGLVRDQLRTKYRFPVRNVGNKPLTLEVLGTSCKCSTAKFSKTVLKTGETANLDVVYQLKSDLEGRFNGRVMVKTNDPSQPHLMFFVQGAGYRTKLISTQQTIFGKMAPDSTKSYLVAIHDPGYGELKVTGVEASISQIIENSKSQPVLRHKIHSFDEVDLSQLENVKLTKFDKVVELIAEVPFDCPPGNFEFTCNIKTNLLDSPNFEVVAIGRVLSDLKSNPEVVVLKAKDEDSTILDYSLCVESISGRAIPDMRVSLGPSLHLLEYDVLDSNGTKTVDLKIEIPKEGSRWTDGKLHFVSSDGRKLDVPVVYSSQ